MRKSLIIGIIVSLIALNICLAWQWVFTVREIKLLNEEAVRNRKSHQIIIFTQLLTDTVLSQNREISFEDRLDLEKAVRDLNDQEIFDQWQKFTKSTGDIETQKNFTDLIKLLLIKMNSQGNYEG
jgi:hypothetical protein